MLGAVEAMLLYRMTADLFSSRVLAVIALLAVLMDPGYFLYQHIFFYPFIVQSLLVILVFTAYRLLSRRRLELLLVVAMLLGVVCNTRALFHPIWAVLFFMLTLLLLRSRGQLKDRSVRHWLVPSAALLVALVTLWPIKNLSLFGVFGFSSWVPYNLARETDESCPELVSYVAWGVIPSSVADELRRFGERHRFSDLRVVADSWKTGGGRNWNHMIFTSVCRDLAGRAIEWRLRHPAAWLAHAARNVLKWCRPTYVHPYTQTFPATGNKAFRRYCDVHRRVFHGDFSSRSRRTSVADPGAENRSDDRSLPVTPFVAGLPIIMGLSLVFAVSDMRRRRDGAVMLLVWMTTLWVLAVPCLTDGAEGNRMRYSVTPLVVMLTIFVCVRATEKLSSWRGSRRRGAGVS
jgi:hypothetical protein